MNQRILGTRISRIKPVNRPKQLSLREYYEKRNKILIVRETGGLGDIFMHRMMFEDFKNMAQDFEIVFACPKQYHEAVEDHPFVSEVLDSQHVNPYDYLVHFNTTTACGRYEMKVAPLSDLHRSDIWSRHCGVVLQNHDMHIKLSDEEIRLGKARIESLPGYRGQPTVALCPISAMLGKNLNLDQLGGVLQGILSRGLFPFAVHTKPIPEIMELRAQMISGISIRQWMGILHEADYVISVDTAAFHYRGGIGKPLVGIFSFADGKVYGKYFQKWELVQKHRDDGNWPCGPCFNWTRCTQDPKGTVKPCMREITANNILAALDRLIEKYPAG